MAASLAGLEPHLALAHAGGLHAHPARSRALCAIVVAMALVGCSDDVAKAKVVADATTDAGADVAAIGAGEDTAVATLTATHTGAATGPRVELQPTLLDNGDIEVRVALRDIDDLFGVATHLRYDSDVLELVTSKGHPVLAGSGWEPRTLLHAKPGRILLGGARVRIGGSPYSPLQGAKVGNQIWATLTFRKIAAGETALSFDASHTLARAANYSLVPVQWQGLTIQGGGGQ